MPGIDDFAAAGPLVRRREATATHTRALHARVGLPTEGPVHVIVLFLESVRAFEMEHPALWPSVVPRTRALLAQHGLRFPTAYSSAWGGAQTVEAQFETLNSVLPNFRGPAVYRAYPDIRVKSLAAVARDHGYHTVWISGSSENLLNKRGFESQHGTERFFGLEYLSAIPFEATHDWCGYPDQLMLQEAVRIQRYTPHVPIGQHQMVELMTRLPFALVTKHLPAPGAIALAVHQIDVAPTVAEIAGFADDVPWVGRNALDGGGSPWVLGHDEQLHFRSCDHACYTLQGDDAPRCYRVDAGTDPMLRAELSPVRADPAEMRFFQWVTIAAHQAIARNQIMPAVKRASF